jgi:hypothetical protein
MRPAFRHARSLVSHDAHLLHASVPTFLCPALLRNPLSAPVSSSTRPQPPKCFSTFERSRQLEHATISSTVQDGGLEPPPDDSAPAPFRQTLPHSCPGCGAPAQVYDKTEAGYYNIDRRHVKAFLDYEPTKEAKEKAEDDVYTAALKQADPALLEELGLEKGTIDNPQQAEPRPSETPVCDRCHNLVHHGIGTPILHPTVEAIHQTIAESPHRRNHIYHVVDAADFPLSLIPNLQSSLRLPKLRSHNRRARHKGWVGENRIAEVSFIITRADLLAPLKEQVDKLLPYMQEVLRQALGRVNSLARLGNVHLVSAKRGWWTKNVKEDIWERGGAGWMVGKVNVGKSNLFEVVFPKGRGADYEDIRRIRTTAEKEAMIQAANTPQELVRVQRQLAEEDADNERRRRQPVLEPEDTLPEEDEENYDPDALLPPIQPYTPFPVLPVASSLPGTTASPIRIPFGRNRGELIDLPGLARTNPDLSTFVKREEQDELVMKHRVAAERYVLKPGQSLVLGGGLIRITPRSESLVFLVHPFVPLHPHITATEKAIGLQEQNRESGVSSILVPNVGDKMKSAGIFPLKWDVTKKLAGPLTSAVAGKMRPENLPFRILSTDILIEGVGWVEVSAQTRKPRGWKPVGMVKKDPNHARHERERRLEGERRRIEANYRERQGGGGERQLDAFDRAGFGRTDSRDRRGNRAVERDEYEEEEEADEDEQFPEVEVFSPLGKYIGARMPMCGSVLGGPKPVSSRDRKARPRRSMVSVKRQRKPQGKGE